MLDLPVLVRATKLIIAAMLCFLLSAAAMQLAAISNGSTISPAAPAAGFAIFLVWRMGWIYSISIFVGTICAYLAVTELSPVSASTVALGTVIEAVCGAALIEWILASEERLGELALPVGLVATSLLAPAVGATVGVSALCLSALQWSAFIDEWYKCWAGNAVGCLIALPLFDLLGTLMRQPVRTWRHQGRQLAVAFLWAAASAVTTYGANSFGSGFGSGLAFLCLAFPLAVILAASLRPIYTLFCIAAMAAVSLALTTQSLGPFRWGTMNDNLVSLQIFIASIAAAVIFLQAFVRIGGVRRPVTLMLAGSVLGSALMWVFVANETIRDQEQVNRIIERESHRIQSRMNEYLNILNASAALIKTYNLKTGQMPGDVWKSYVEELGLTNRLPGLKALSIARRVSRNELPAFVAAQRLIWPDFSIRPVPGGEKSTPDQDLFVITNSEPIEFNRLVLGIDLATERNRRLSAELAAQTKRPTMSARITLVKGFPKELTAEHAFIVFHPLFIGEKNIGWVYGAFNVENFFKGLRDTSDSRLAWTVAFPESPYQAVYSSTPQTTPSTLATAVRTTELELASGRLLFSWHKLPDFGSSNSTTAAWIMAAIVLASIAAAAMLLNLEMVKIRAEHLAARMTHDLEKHRLAIFHASKMSSLGHMAAGVAHEINNPLTIIAGLVHQIMTDLERAPDSSGMRQLPRLNKITETVRRISAIIRGLQSFSRSGEALPREMTPVALIVETVMDFCREKFRNSGVDLRLAEPPDIDVPAIAVQMEQVLMNLLTNSYDAVLELDERWVEITYEVLSDRVAIMVTDSGAGLPSEVSSRIMEPFFTTKPVGRGTGLGLSICRGILENHGGRLIYISDSPHTRFRIEIPRETTSTLAARFTGNRA